MIASANTIHQHLWGKTKDGDPAAFHPLFCHMIDVGMVASAILLAPEAHHFVVRLAQTLGTDERHVPSIVPFLVALHDIGKASPSFQAKVPIQWERVRRAGFDLAGKPMNEFSHGIESGAALPQIIERLGLLIPGGSQATPRTYRALAYGLPAHHGTFFTPQQRGYPEIPPVPDEREPWQEPWRHARRELVDALRQALLLDPSAVELKPKNLSAVCMILCGLTVLADWIGSDQQFFEPYAGDLNFYPSEARRRAQEALARRDLLSYLPTPRHEPSFSRLFPNFTSPRPLQRAFDPASLPQLPAQTLAVIEAPTGEGKTEAALLLAARLASSHHSRGFYFALPTMATSNQMFDRVARYLERQLGAGQRANLLLVHGQAGLSDELAVLC